ncbi:MAG: HIT domain-containing protein [Patescibacteria group bacterium]
MEDCIFCKIVKKQISTQFVKETNDFVVFADINPAAPTHLLIIPKQHHEDLLTITNEVWQGVRYVALELQKQLALPGFRLENNVGTMAAVKHFHVHFKAGIK